MHSNIKSLYKQGDDVDDDIIIVLCMFVIFDDGNGV